MKVGEKSGKGETSKLWVAGLSVRYRGKPFGKGMIGKDEARQNGLRAVKQ